MVHGSYMISALLPFDRCSCRPPSPAVLRPASRPQRLCGARRSSGRCRLHKATLESILASTRSALPLRAIAPPIRLIAYESSITLLTRRRIKDGLVIDGGPSGNSSRTTLLRTTTWRPREHRTTLVHPTGMRFLKRIQMECMRAVMSLRICRFCSGGPWATRRRLKIRGASSLKNRMRSGPTIPGCCSLQLLRCVIRWLVSSPIANASFDRRRSSPA